MRHVLRYLSGTSSLGLHYPAISSSSLKITAYSDADFATDEATRRSISGFVIFLGPHLIHWSAKRQGSVATSTAHAELIALHSAVSEVTYIRSVLSSMGLTTDTPVVYEDNAAVIAYIHGTGSASALKKHVDVKLMSVREQISAGAVIVKCVESAANLADLFTKPLPQARFLDLRSRLGLSDSSQ
jgi:hypothetical protein